MKQKSSDEQFELMMKTLVRDSSLTDREIDEIADSPALWWAVKRNIEKRKALTLAPWPPAQWLRRALVFGVPTLAAAAIVLSVFVWRSGDAVKNDVAAAEPTTSPIVQTGETNGPDEAGPTVPASKTAARSIGRAVAKKVAVKRASQAAGKIRATPESQEIKTEFIALSYARNPDSGQIVRVKVPSSMMVTLGLVSTVEKPTDLIDADVVVGDDGLTRAIRFVR